MKKMLKKIFWCTAVLASVFAFTTCKTVGFREPVLTLRSVDLVDINFSGAQFLCKVNVENPNSFNIPLPEIDWEFFVAANSFLKGTIKSSTSIGSRRTTVVDIPVSLTYLEMLDSFLSLRGNNSVDYKVALAAKIPIPVLGEKVWHLEKSGNMPILRAPSVNFQGIEVKNLGLSSIDFEIALEVTNSNSVALLLNNLSYSLIINNSPWTSGNVRNAPRLNAGGKTVVPISFSINSLNMIRDITQIITGNRDVQYALRGDLGLGLDMPGMKDLGTALNFSGTTKLRR